MTDRNDLDFEARLRRTLQASAPAAHPQMADRLLGRTAAEAQRRRWSLFSTLGPAVVAAAVVALAVVVGLSIGQLPRVGDDASPTATAEPSATPSPSPSAATTPSATATATPSTTPDASPEAQRCTNEQLGFALSYPVDWHTNEEIEQLFGDPPTSACTFFGPEPMEILPSSELPPTVAITFGRQDVPSPDPGPARLLMENEVTVGGLPATAREWEWTEDGFMVSRGDRFSSYEIQLSDGTFLIASTNSSAHGDHEDRKRVLDAMMESLQVLDE